MTNVVKVVAKIKSLDANVDDMSNHFVCETDEGPPFSGIGSWLVAVQHFYNNVGTGGGAPLSAYMPAVYDTGANHATLTGYDITAHLNGSPAGAPVFSIPWTFGVTTPPPTNKPTPEGCSACLSFRTDYGTDVEFGTGTRPRARDRNRIYVPINSNTLQEDVTTHRVGFLASFITDCLAAMFDLSETVSSGGHTYNWRVWSRKNADVKLVTELWMDDRPDYQRRRTDPTPGTRVFRAAASA